MSYYVEAPHFGFKELPDRILVREDGAYGASKEHGEPIIDHWYVPEQAIAATLGRGTCDADETDLIPFVRADSDDYDVDYIHVMECSVCGGTYEHVNGSYEFCPRCGARIVEVGE